MKKTIYIFATIFFFLSFSITYATSGACSYHSGVNCSAGASYTGRVQCNDGWINSSVYFSDVIECKSQSSCSRPQPSTYTSYAQCDGLYSSLITGGSTRYTPEIATGQVSACRQQVIAYQSALERYNTCISIPVRSNYDESRIIRAEIDRQMADIKTMDTQINQLKNLQTCQRRYGSNSIANSTSNSQCACRDGYSWNSNKTTCIKTIIELKKTIENASISKIEKKQNEIIIEDKKSVTDQELVIKPIERQGVFRKIKNFLKSLF